ncbi:unnamed protein product [Chironomus riparius]|uniref:Methyltransferase domain-containing protein n=1 Tax=Chironomus riparius TaxID=315576 RepID=A0A9N9RVQ7_9DIPT|nr:unnamed protein product [Chironomus riparius]
MNRAQVYAETNSQQIAGALKFFDIFGDFLKFKFQTKKINLLDIGSGCGKVLSEITFNRSKLNFSKIIGIDKSNEMLKFAVKNYENDLISFCLMDIEEEIPKILRDQQFDMVTSFYCLHWIKDIKNVFENIYELLNSNGIFCCTFLQSTKINDIWDALAIKYPLYMNDWRQHFTPLWSLENANEILIKYLQDCKFKIIKFHDVKNEKFEFRNLQKYSKMLETVNPCFNSMPDFVQKKFLKDQISEIMSLKKDDLYVVPLRVMYFIVEK